MDPAERPWPGGWPPRGRAGRRHGLGLLTGPIRRRSDGRMLGGIALGLSERIGVDVTLVRVGLVLLALFTSGIGIAAYVVGWLLLPCDDEPGTIGTKALADGKGIALTLAVVPVFVVVVVLVSSLHAGWFGSMVAPSFVAAMGLVLVWRNGSDDERAVLRRAVAPLAQLGSGSERSWRTLLIRLGIGILLAGGAVLDLSRGRSGPLLRPLSGIGLVLAALIVVFGPWWLDVARDLVIERQARLRAEERADMAARVHDSVLQTLTLIQRSADQPQRVAQLARVQERELRSWLFDGDMPGSFRPGSAITAGPGAEPVTVAGAVRRIQEEVEAAHSIRVETVVVGDCPLTDDLDALLAAGREATVNAGKWSGAEAVSLFVEVEAEKVSLFVRDRGKGFDLEAVAADRRGVAESVLARVIRRGGTAVVHTAPGRGTEVELTMARRAGSSAGR